MTPLDWSRIDTVLLDMDGTLLDLHFDNHFWLEYLPQRYAERHGQSLALAKAELEPLFFSHQGKLTWYCLDFWSAELGFSMRELKEEIAHLIALRPDADTFLGALQRAGKRVALITNAHRDSPSLKLGLSGAAASLNRRPSPQPSPRGRGDQAGQSAWR